MARHRIHCSLCRARGEPRPRSELRPVRLWRRRDKGRGRPSHWVSCSLKIWSTNIDVVEAVGAAVRYEATLRRFHSPRGAGRGEDQMTEVSDDAKRWTAKRHWALVRSILRGETSVQEKRPGPTASRSRRSSKRRECSWRRPRTPYAQGPKDEEGIKDKRIRQFWSGRSARWCWT